MWKRQSEVKMVLAEIRAMSVAVAMVLGSPT